LVREGVERDELSVVAVRDAHDFLRESAGEEAEDTGRS
jgi:hypothetical protein